MQTLLSQPIIEMLFEHTKAETDRLIEAGLDPQLGVMLVGQDPDSLKYIEIKSRRAKEAGIILSLYHLEAETPFPVVQESLDFLSKDPEMAGIILQLPLPPQFSAEQVTKLLESIIPVKDVDGLSGTWQKNTSYPKGIQEILAYKELPLPPMVYAVISLLDYYEIDPASKKIVLVGGGRLVGTPLSFYFKACGYDVTVVDENTENILAITIEADILICGTGQKELVTYQWVKPGATVIDCAADVHMDSVSQVAGAIAPPIGGIGPLTVAWLLHNTIEASKNQLSLLS